MRWRSVIDPDRAASYRAAGHWRDVTLDDTFAAAASARPDAVAVVDERGRWTYAQLADEVSRLAGALRALGVGPGDPVSVQLPNRSEFVVAHLALERLGAVTNPMLTQYRRHDIGRMLERLDSVAAIFPAHERGYDHGVLWREIQRDRPSLRSLVAVGDGPAEPGVHRFVDLVAGGEPVPHEAGERDGDAVTIVIFTSGTVASKGVMHTHNTTSYGADHYGRELGLGPGSVFWMPSPIAHGTGLQWGVRSAMHLGATLVLQDRWSATEACDLIARERCEVMMGATPFIHDLRRLGPERRDDLASMQYFVCAGAPIPPELVTGVRDELNIEILRAYGMSEHFVSAICRPGDPEAQRLGSDGRPFPGTELAVYDAGRSRQLPAGQEGELAVRGPGVAVGYLGDPERTADTWRAGGWQFTDDLAVLDESGFVRIRGRLKDLIIRGGLNVSPSEVEAALIEHPGVGEVGVVGVPHERLGEQICAVVVPAAADPSATPTLEELTAFLLERGMSKLKLPELLVLREELPRTASGKIRKDQLRQDVLRTDMSPQVTVAP